MLKTYALEDDLDQVLILLLSREFLAFFVIFQMLLMYVSHMPGITTSGTIFAGNFLVCSRKQVRY